MSTTEHNAKRFFQRIELFENVIILKVELLFFICYLF